MSSQEALRLEGSTRPAVVDPDPTPTDKDIRRGYDGALLRIENARHECVKAEYLAKRAFGQTEVLLRQLKEARAVARFYYRLITTGQASLVLPGHDGPPGWLTEPTDD